MEAGGGPLHSQGLPMALAWGWPRQDLMGVCLPALPGEPRVGLWPDICAWQGPSSQLDVRVGGWRCPQPALRGHSSRGSRERPIAGTQSRTADLSPFNTLGSDGLLFSGRLFNFILKICLHSIQNRFLIALSLKNVEQN